MSSRKNKSSASAAKNAEKKNADNNHDSDSSDDSSSSSSEPEFHRTSKRADWKIDLSTFSRTLTKIETEINGSRRCSEMISAYFDKHNDSILRLPWEESRHEYGINPLHKFLYIACDPNDEHAVATTSSDLCVKVNEGAIDFIEELHESNADYFAANKYVWGDERGSCIATYMQILNFPIKAFNAFRRYWDVKRADINELTKKQAKRLLKKCSRWLRANHAIWETIVHHLDVKSTDICSGLEPSNGLMLLRTMKSKFGHTHAQCLTQLLRELTNVTPKKTNSGKTESVQKYMDRVQRIARDASRYPEMKVPVPLPLVKVFALEGLLKSSNKYSSVVTLAYSNDLSDSMHGLTSKLQTVEGMRGKQIHDEYGSSASTNFASSQVNTAKAGRTGSRLNDLCDLPNHFGHTNAQCSVKKLRKLRNNRKAKPSLYDTKGNRCCDFAANNISCPFRKCKYSHKMKGATPWGPTVYEGGRPTAAGRAFLSHADDSTESDSDSSDAHRSSKSRRTKSRRKKKHRSKRSHKSSSESDSMDFP